MAPGSLIYGADRGWDWGINRHPWQSDYPDIKNSAALTETLLLFAQINFAEVPFEMLVI